MNHIDILVSNPHSTTRSYRGRRSNHECRNIVMMRCVYRREACRRRLPALAFRGFACRAAFADVFRAITRHFFFIGRPSWNNLLMHISRSGLHTVGSSIIASANPLICVCSLLFSTPDRAAAFLHGIGHGSGRCGISLAIRAISSAAFGRFE